MPMIPRLGGVLTASASGNCYLALYSRSQAAYEIDPLASI